MIKQKIKIVEYAPSAANPKMLVAYTANGGRLDLYPCDVPLERCRTKGRLFVTGSGLFFSLTHRRGLKHVFENFGLARRTCGRHSHNGVRGCDYPQMRDYGLGYCHVLVCTTFHGPRPVVNGILYVCDHKNGNIMDWSEDNLEWVSPRENTWRARHVLQVLRAKKFDLTAFNGAAMDKWFALFRALEMAGRKPKELSREELEDLFRRYRLVDPQEQMEYEMTHHMEF